MKLVRWFLPVFLGVLLCLTIVTPVLAAVDPPDDTEISGVWVYRNCREEGDQLYLVSYFLNYSTIPGETVTELFLCRLMDGNETVEVVTPYSYYNSGYGHGVVAIYFDADDAPTWEDLYTMELLGNPFQEWTGGLPSDSVSSINFDAWEDNELGITQTMVGGRVIDMANDLETAWGKDMVTVSDTGKQILTTYAAAYFVNVIPHIYEIAPDIFAEGQGGWSGTFPPEIPGEQDRTDYADELETNIIGTPFDLTALATSWGISRGPLSAVLYYGCLVAILILIARRIGSYKPLMLLSIPFVIVGAFVGVPLIVTILAGLVALGMTAYVIFYKPSSA